MGAALPEAEKKSRRFSRWPFAWAFEGIGPGFFLSYTKPLPVLFLRKRPLPRTVRL